MLKAVQAGMTLPATKVLPSFAALRDYGNTSCSTTWYVMAYMESIGSVYKHQQIMQVRGERAGGRGLGARLGATCVCIVRCATIGNSQQLWSRLGLHCMCKLALALGQWGWHFSVTAP